MVVAIISAVVAITTAVISASEGAKNRKTTEDLAKYEATKYKQFYQPTQTSNSLLIVLAIALVAVLLFLIYQINKAPKNNG